MVNIENAADRHIEPKSWGYEEWIVNNDQYCGKRLHFDVKDGCTSLHFHVLKHETMYVESGSFHVIMIDRHGVHDSKYMGPGDSLEIPRFTPHRIIATKVPAVLVEFSTHHQNSDSYRINR